MGYYEQWNFGVQHELRGGAVLEARYVGTNGVHLGEGSDVNQVHPNLINLVTTGADMQALRPYPQYLGIQGYQRQGVSFYDALQLSGKKQFSNGLSFLVNYTWSRMLDTGSGAGPGGYGGGSWWVPGIQDTYAPRSNYGNSYIDMPNTFNGQFLYQLPFGYQRKFMNRSGVLDAFLGGWQVSSVFMFHTGNTYTPTMGTANLSGSLANNWLPNRIANGALANPTVSEWFDPAAFVSPNEGTFGNSGMCILRGPPYRDFDFSLAKRFRISKLGEAGQLEIRAEAVDLPNYPNFGIPNYNIGTGGVGVITSAYTNRNIQLGAHLRF
jgi:hypothetical protein